MTDPVSPTAAMLRDMLAGFVRAAEMMTDPAEEFLNMIQSGPGDLKLDNLLSFAAAGDEVDIYSDFDEDEDSYDGCSMVASLSAADALRLRDWLTTWLERK